MHHACVREKRTWPLGAVNLEPFKKIFGELRKTEERGEMTFCGATEERS